MPRSKGGHLSLQDRIFIEDSLCEGTCVGQIARALDVSWHCVANEITKRRVRESGRYISGEGRNTCARRAECAVRGICGNGGSERCSRCAGAACNRVCPDFAPVGDCPRTKRAPYVCNGCRARYTIGCRHPYWLYDARMAHEQSRWAMSSTRSGVACTEEELKKMVAVVKPLLKKGQSLEHIWQSHMGEFPVSFRTFYRYINLGILDICNLELPKKVKYKPRRKPVDRSVPFRPNLAGRTYADFEALADEVRMSAVEMDCVVGGRGSTKAILTLLFRRSSFQIMVVMPAHTAGCVRGALDHIEMLCGKEAFARCFGTILTDRGPEFLDFQALEESVGGGKRCSVYYCDPLRSGQKGRCEKNHVELRKIVPKGADIDLLTNYEMAEICSHVNSYTRPYLGGLAPIDIAERMLPAELLEGLAIRKVPPDDVIMRPTLLRELGIGPKRPG